MVFARGCQTQPVTRMFGFLGFVLLIIVLRPLGSNREVQRLCVRTGHARSRKTRNRAWSLTTPGLNSE